MNTQHPSHLDRWPTLPRTDLAAALAAAIPDCVDPAPDAAALAALPEGGRRTALAVLSAFDPKAYARTRNHVGGGVSGLSQWIRHGVLSTAEIRDHVLARVARPEEAEKFVSELAWRDYWRRVQAALGDRIMADIEPAAALPRQSDRLDVVPDDVLTAATGMRCIDAFVRTLQATGRLHNHERMWLAAWLVHVRRVRWQAGADWFLRHLLDGDPASNHLSWQWVAGTFAAKPYIFNRENLQTFTADAHCTPCPLLGRCDVEGSYDDLTARLFAAGPPPTRAPLRIRPAASWRPSRHGTAARPLVWLTLDSASATGPAAVAHPGAPKLFVLDSGWLAEERPTLKRLVFLFECLRDVPGLTIGFGDPGVIVPAVARAAGCDGVALAATPCPRVRRAAHACAVDLPVTVHEWPSLCADAGVDDLGRFSRFWNRVRGSATRPTRPPRARCRPDVPAPSAPRRTTLAGGDASRRRRVPGPGFGDARWSVPGLNPGQDRENTRFFSCGTPFSGCNFVFPAHNLPSVRRFRRFFERGAGWAASNFSVLVHRSWEDHRWRRSPVASP